MESGKPAFLSPPSCPPTRGYSQVAIVDAGRLAFVSGQVGVDHDWRLAKGFRAQLEVTFRNLRAAVEHVGATLGHIAKLTVYVVGDEDLAIYAAVRDAAFSGQVAMPASTFIRVAGLYSPDALVEIEAVVAVPGTA